MGGEGLKRSLKIIQYCYIFYNLNIDKKKQTDIILAMSNAKYISKAVISRLPRYHRYLKILLDEGVERISSKELSKRMKATASQIRQDLNHFGGFGQQGYGYNVKSLYNEISKILGVEQAHNLIVLGAGNLGRALVKYKGFVGEGFNFCSMFDIDPNLCGKSVGGVKIRSIEELPDYLENNDIDIAVITLPTEAAQESVLSLYSMGVRFFWNFSGRDLELPEDAIISNVHLLESLLQLSYMIGAVKNEE